LLCCIADGRAEVFATDAQIKIQEKMIRITLIAKRLLSVQLNFKEKIGASVTGFPMCFLPQVH